MRILLTTHQFLPEFSAGTEVLTWEVARELKRRAHDVRVLTGSPDRKEDPADRCDAYVFDGIPVRRIHSLAPGNSAPAELVLREYDDPEAALQLDLMRQTWTPDLVHAFHLQRLSGSVVRRCVELRIPLVYTPTDFWMICPLNQLRLPDGSQCGGPTADSSNCILHLAMVGRHRGRSVFYRWIPDALPGTVLGILPDAWSARSGRIGAARQLQRRAPATRDLLGDFDRILPPTDSMARALRAHGAPEKSMQTTPYGIDQTGYDTIRPVGRGITLRIGFIGALNPNKGAHVLLRAAAAIGADAAFTIALYGDETADPEYTSMLQALAAGDDRIRFCGTFERERLPAVLDELDVLVVPSIWAENMPLVMLSALTAKRPVIGSNVPGVSEVVTDGFNGHLFDTGDSRQLCSILQSLIADRSQLSRLSRNTAPARTIAQYTDELETTYRAILMERATPDLSASRNA